MRHPHFPGALTWIWHLGTMALLLAGTTLLVLWLLKRRKTGPQPAPFGHGPWHPGPHAATHGPAPVPPSDAVRILDERLARGDIDVDDYLTRRAALLGDRPNGTEFNPGPAPDAPPSGTAAPDETPPKRQEGDDPSI